MTTIIQDGTGTGKKAKINDRNRLLTNTVQVTDDEMSAIDEKAYITNTSEITLTSASASAIFYFKNTGTEDVIASRFSLSSTDTTGGSGKILFEILRNPSTGTIIDDAQSISPSNRNFGSSNTLTSNSYEGDEAKTFTDGTVLSRTFFTAGSSILATLSFVFPRGSSIGFRVTPPTGNTSLKVIAGLNVHMDGFDQ